MSGWRSATRLISASEVSVQSGRHTHIYVDAGMALLFSHAQIDRGLIFVVYFLDQRQFDLTIEHGHSIRNY